MFRVDLRLRPEGSRGAIANSLPSLERYYESWGRPWERQAWLKARRVGGKPRARRRGPRHAHAPSSIPATPRRAWSRTWPSSTAASRPSWGARTVEPGFDVKNGVGGIREIEFFVQALQLIHAGQRPALRTRSTLGALDQLCSRGSSPTTSAGPWPRPTATCAGSSTCSSSSRGRQTQRLPADQRAFELLARRLGHDSAAEIARDPRAPHPRRRPAVRDPGRG